LRVYTIVLSVLFWSLFHLAHGSDKVIIQDSVNHVIEQSSDPYALVQSYSQLCWTKRSSDPENAIAYGNMALRIIDKTPTLDTLKPEVLNFLGVVYRNKGDYMIAMNYYKDALTLSTQQQNHVQIAYSNNNLGGISTLKGDYFNAVKYLEKAHYYFKVVKDTSGMAYVAINLGNLYRHNTYLSDAIDYFDQAILYKEAINDTVGLAIAMNLKAISYFQSEEYKKALGIFEKLQSKYEHNQNDYGLATLNNYLGLIEVNNKNFVEANNHFEEAIKLFDKIFDKQGRANALINMALSHHGLGNNKTALKKLASGYSVAKEIGDNEALASAYKNYSQIYAQLNRYQEAYNYEVMYRDAILESFSFQFREKLVALRINNEFEKETQKNESLEKDNAELIDRLQSVEKTKTLFIVFTSVLLLILIFLLIPLILYYRRSKNNKFHNIELVSSNEQLSEANHNRERLLSIIGHDLKNPFNSVLGLTTLLVDEWDTIADEERRYIINEVHGTGNTLYELLDNLLLWAKNQSNTIHQRKELFDINEQILNVYELFRNQASFKEIEIKLNIGKENMVYADPNMISTVLRNLMSNAIKFTRRGGTIQLGLTRRSEELEVDISDNGKGILPEDLQKILDDKDSYSTKGTDNETGTGLGLLLVRDFVKLNSGVFWVKSRIGVGSRFYFTLPYKK